MAWASLIVTMLLGLIVKPFLIIKIANYTFEDILSVFKPCFIVTLVSIIAPCFLYKYIDEITSNNVLQFIIMTIISLLSVASSVWYLGLSKQMQLRLIKVAKKKLPI